MRGFDNNIYTQIGFVLLIGMSAKNAILIIEFAKQQRDEMGKSTIDAALEAARLRFRPILMTALSFLLGVFPLVIASGAGANSRVSLGTAVFGGMLLATVAGVFMIPLLYVVVQTIAEKMSRKKSVPIPQPTPTPETPADGRAARAHPRTCLHGESARPVPYSRARLRAFCGTHEGAESSEIDCRHRGNVEGSKDVGANPLKVERRRSWGRQGTKPQVHDCVAGIREADAGPSSGPRDTEAVTVQGDDGGGEVDGDWAADRPRRAVATEGA